MHRYHAGTKSPLGIGMRLGHLEGGSGRGTRERRQMGLRRGVGAPGCLARTDGQEPVGRHREQSALHLPPRTGGDGRPCLGARTAFGSLRAR